ncbi:CD36-like lysosomal integral membrane protein II [Oopsacas minuta]|uniref:CD36-like lysosomal integral membrane protein II n=1 Tax=Oopsacas minuta TaxID=111878 RepID=A0AAV7JAU6_9METZ|nr:CD36-like lysosomal integral membrane protein II [Oopsacas minuta]
MAENGREDENLSEDTLLIKENLKQEKKVTKYSHRLIIYTIIFVLILFITSFILTISGGVLWFVTYKDIHTQVTHEMSLQNGTLIYEQWIAPDARIYKDFYIFNWTNPSDLALGIAPKLIEVGPYRYREYRNKTVTAVSENGCHVIYTQHKLFVFDRGATSVDLSEDDVIQTLNLPLAGAVHIAKKSIFLTAALNSIILETNSSLYKSLTVKQLIWGYEDDFIKELKKLYIFPKDKNFSIFINDNPQDQEPSIVNTGVCDSKALGEFIQWDGNRQMDIWGDQYANMINGTEGFFFRPFLNSNDRITFFVDDAMRSIELACKNSHTEHKGIDTLRYGLPLYFLQNASCNPANARWYQFCPQGLFYIGNSSIMPDVPAYGSKPHFLDADPNLLSNVSGLFPDREIHDLFVDIEPTTGVTIAVHNRVQINFKLERTEIVYFNEIPSLLYLPILYSDESITLSKELYTHISSKLNTIDLVFSISLVVVVAGLFCLLASTVSSCCLLTNIRSVLKKDSNPSSD